MYKKDSTLNIKFIISIFPFPQLTDVVRAFVDGEDARSSGGGSVGAGVARVPDVRRVGGDGVPTGGGRYDTADAEACSTSACSSSSLAAEESR